ncbi:uncharacterized protein I303_107431 [Kwoniella dejecticola CBS 10117]|uniref:Magnesium transporter NIPA2 n=1 Tax=Kwoniella dejecticola CBS 10117 TaxID=1296121 RepID=A0A1A5ZZP4_9TREE|nr:uncharacterized protein I303_06835 [Kwoniella dejecticola CBS 10117]OBR83272.1 hypothetical protein I303_06835 [Kwoniella dejecticola CBS 10117]
MSSSASASASASVSASASHAAGLVDTTGNSTFKIVGICLAVGSGLLIGSSFVIKKKGLLQSTEKYGNVAGEGHGYLKSWLWWVGMITMILGEVCNFVAYAFTEAILVTPMGALSVVVAAILSHFLLKEKLTFFGWIGCTLCIMGAVILALNAPEEQSVTTINEFKKLFLSVGFLVWASLLIAGSLVVIFFVAPKWGKKSMLPYISICSLIGGISVSCTQGLGASIVTSIRGDNQVKNWFFWFLFVFVVVTLLTEINYLNKALELFNTSMVVPVYFCFFSSATLITSFILYQGLKASAVTLITMVLGFLVTCLGITLLQLSKVDPESLDKLDRKSTILMQAAKHQTEDAEKGQVTAAEDPGMDALRGGFGAVGSIIRARSVSRRMSSASSGTGFNKGMYGYSSGNLSTHGLGHLERFQLSDNPMPADAMDQISLHSAKSPAAISPHGFPTGHNYFPSPQRSKSQLKASHKSSSTIASLQYIPLDIIASPSMSLPSYGSSSIPSSSYFSSNTISTPSNSKFKSPEKSAASDSKTNNQANNINDAREQFEEADVVHQYHYGNQPDDAAIHTYRQHSHPPPSPSSEFPQMGQRRPSGGPVLPVPEEDEEEDLMKEKSNPVIVRDKAFSDEPRQLPRLDTHLNPNYLDPYSNLQPAPGPSSSPSSNKLNSGHRGFSGIFHFPSGPDLSLGHGNHGKGRSRSKSVDRSEEKKFPGDNKKKKAQQDSDSELDRQERAALVNSSFSDDLDEGEGRRSDDDVDDGEMEVYEGRTTEGGHSPVEFGVGHRVNLSTSTTTTTTAPMSAATATTFGTGTTDRMSSGSSGNGAGAGGALKGPRGPRNRDPPGFAGPRYGS